MISKSEIVLHEFPCNGHAALGQTKLTMKRGKHCLEISNYYNILYPVATMDLIYDLIINSTVCTQYKLPILFLSLLAPHLGLLNVSKHNSLITINLHILEVQKGWCIYISCKRHGH